MPQGPHIAKLVERNRSVRQGSFPYENAEWMRDAYLTRGLTLRQMATEAQCGLRTIARWMAIHDIETRKDWPRPRGPANANWRGARICPSCGGTKDAGAQVCMRCRDYGGDRNPKWRGENAEYTAIHARVVALRGKPSEHRCAHCGGEATEWAYDHADPLEKRNAVGRDDGPYSLDPDHYLPLCTRCHRKLDSPRRDPARKA